MRAAFEENRDEIAALIVEPIPGNMGVVLPRPGYLPLLRSLCDEHGALLIFDEVITGFRVGARRRPGSCTACDPTSTCLGKIAGGGLPLGIYGGRADIMDVVAPVGPGLPGRDAVGEPAGGGRRPGDAQAPRRARLRDAGDAGPRAGGRPRPRGPARRGSRRGCSGSARRSRCSSRPKRWSTWPAPRKADTDLYAKFFHGMLERGFMLPPAQFEAAFVSLAHTMEDINASRPPPARCSTDVVAKA